MSESEKIGIPNEVTVSESNNLENAIKATGKSNKKPSGKWRPILSKDGKTLVFKGKGKEDKKFKVDKETRIKGPNILNNINKLAGQIKDVDDVDDPNELLILIQTLDLYSIFENRRIVFEKIDTWCENAKEEKRGKKESSNQEQLKSLAEKIEGEDGETIKSNLQCIIDYAEKNQQIINPFSLAKKEGEEISSLKAKIPLNSGRLMPIHGLQHHIIGLGAPSIHFLPIGLGSTGGGGVTSNKDLELLRMQMGGTLTALDMIDSITDNEIAEKLSIAKKIESLYESTRKSIGNKGFYLKPETHTEIVNAINTLKDKEIFLYRLMSQIRYMLRNEKPGDVTNEEIIKKIHQAQNRTDKLSKGITRAFKVISDIKGKSIEIKIEPN